MTEKLLVDALEAVDVDEGTLDRIWAAIEATAAADDAAAGGEAAGAVRGAVRGAEIGRAHV